MTPELKKQMEEMAEKYAHMGIGKHSETEKIRRYNGYATGFVAASEIYEAKLEELRGYCVKCEGEICDLGDKIETLEKELAALKEENRKYREALEFYAGKTRFGEWSPHLYSLYSYDKFGCLCYDTIGPAIALKALADSSQGEERK